MDENENGTPRDDALVWIENPRGIRDLATWKHWRTHLERLALAGEGYKLLDPEEVEEEEAKVAAAALHRQATSGDAARERWRRYGLI